jgi:hypothetical protein
VLLSLATLLLAALTLLPLITLILTALVLVRHKRTPHSLETDPWKNKPF